MLLSDKKILVTGATGQVGSQILYCLNQKGARPVTHVRENSNTLYIDQLGLEKRHADLRERNSLKALVAGMDMVIHVAGMVDFRQDRLTQFTGINTFGALDMYTVASRAGVRRFVHVSTAAAVGARRRGGAPEGALSEGLVREEHEYNLGHLRIPYIMTKRAAEEELLKAAQTSETELVIVNPSMVVSPSPYENKLARIRRMFARPILPELSNIMNLVDVRDVAPGVVLALEKGRPGERYLLGGDNISARDLVLAVSALIGESPHLVRIPRPLIDVGAGAIRTINILLGRGRVSVYPDLVRMLDFDWAYSSRKAREELGYRSRALHITLRDFLTNCFTGSPFLSA